MAETWEHHYKGLEIMPDYLNHVIWRKTMKAAPPEMSVILCCTGQLCACKASWSTWEFHRLNILKMDLVYNH